MGAEDRKRIELFATIILALIAIGSALQGFAVLPDRVSRNEQDIRQVQVKSGIDHDILLEIRGDVKALREANKSNAH